MYEEEEMKEDAYVADARAIISITSPYEIRSEDGKKYQQYAKLLAHVEERLKIYVQRRELELLVLTEQISVLHRYDHRFWAGWDDIDPKQAIKFVETEVAKWRRLLQFFGTKEGRTLTLHAWEHSHTKDDRALHEVAKSILKNKK